MRVNYAGSSQYKWANDPVVRRNSFNSEPFSYQTHIDCFNRIIKDESTFQYVLMEDEKPIGQIRLSVENDKAVIGYSIDSEFRGLGYGHRILQLITDEVKENHPEIKKLIAKVKSENEASKSIFRRAGYIEYICFEQTI